MAEIEQGIKIKQPVEGLPRLRLTAMTKGEGLAMAPFCHPERSEGIIVVAGFIPASVGDKPRPYGVHQAIKPRSERKRRDNRSGGVHPRLGRGQAPTLRCPPGNKGEERLTKKTKEPV